MWSQSKKTICKQMDESTFGKFFQSDDKLDEGFYIFGGQDSKNKTLNELWVAQPDYEKNKLCFDTKFEYK